MKIRCKCGKEFSCGLKLAKHRASCTKFQVQHYYSSSPENKFVAKKGVLIKKVT